MSQDQTSAPSVQSEAPAQRTIGGTESRAVRETLKALSQELFGSSSRYTKLYTYQKVLTHKVKETVPGENGAPDTEVEKDVPTYAPGTTVKQSTIEHRSVEEVLQMLLDLKARRDAYLAEVKAQQEARKAAAEAEEKARKAQEDLGGSAAIK